MFVNNFTILCKKNEIQSLDYQLHLRLLENDTILLRRYFVPHLGPGRWQECTNSCQSIVQAPCTGRVPGTSSQCRACGARPGVHIWLQSVWTAGMQQL